MYEQLYKYLILNGKIFFPGIGSFVVENISSSIDENIQIIRPPQQTVQFSDNGENYFNQSLFPFLAKENNQTETESENKFNRFVEQLKKSLQTKEVELPALGTLKKYNGSDDFIFVPDHKNLKHLFPLIGLPTELKPLLHKDDIQTSSVEEEKQIAVEPEQIAERPVNSEKEKQVTEQVIVPEEKNTSTTIKEKKDYWWVYAIALAVVAAGGLLYYYLFYIH